MKSARITLQEILNIIAFLLFLFGSSLTHIEHGSELSLWLMTFAVIITTSATILPWLGIQWLQTDTKSIRLLQIGSLLTRFAAWGTFGYAMFQRWARNLPAFHSWITLTTLLWAASIILFIYSRRRCQTGDKSDTLSQDQQ